MNFSFRKMLALITVLAIIITGLSCISVFAENTEKFPVGDINMDGTVDITDAVLLQKIITKKVDKPSNFDTYSDMNSDGETDIKDVTVIQKFLAEIYSELPINKDNPTTKPSATETTTATTSTKPSATETTTVSTSKYDPTATDPDGWNNAIIKP